MMVDHFFNNKDNFFNNKKWMMVNMGVSRNRGPKNGWSTMND